MRCRLPALIICAVASSCSNAKPSNSDAAVSDAAQDSPAEMPSAETGGADAGGDADPGCSPGTVLPSFGGECQNGRCICRTYAPDGGTLIPLTGANMRTDVVSYLLPEPMRAGQPYTFSLSLATRNFIGNLELWGTNAECGPGLERLFNEPFATKVYCTEVRPTQDYAYVLIVEQYAGRADASSAAQSQSDFRACSAGTCP